MEPVGQSAAAVVASGQYWPRLQADCVAGVAHTKPAAQGAATVLPAGQYWPWLQATCVAVVGQ